MPTTSRHVELGQPLANLRRPERQPLRIERMIGRKAEPAMRRARLGKHRRAQPLGHGDQFAHCVRFDHAAADQNRRIARRQQHFGRSAQRLRPAGERRDSAAADGVRSNSASAICTSSGSDRNTGPVGGVSAICTARRMAAGQIFDPLDFGRPFGPRPGHAHHVAPQDRLLESSAGDPAGRR